MYGNSYVFIIGIWNYIMPLFLPSILAVLKGNIYRGQVIKYQLILFAANILINAATVLVDLALRINFIMIICTIGDLIWFIIALVLWFYILINAFRDTEMTLLSRFGINI